MHFLTRMLCLALALSSVAPNAYSDEWNKKSTLTVSGRVELPGIILEPGAYVVKLHENLGKRATVQILNSDESQVIATLVAIPDHRMRPEGDIAFTYHEVKGDAPRPMQSWFYPGDLQGLEFVYSKARAAQIAKATDEHVMASNTKDPKECVIMAVTPNGKEVVVDEPPNTTQVARQKPR